MAEENIVLKNTWHSELHHIRHRGFNQLPSCIAQFQTAFLYIYSLRLGQRRSAFAFKASLFIILVLLRTVTNFLEHECNYYLYTAAYSLANQQQDLHFSYKHSSTRKKKKKIKKDSLTEAWLAWGCLQPNFKCLFGKAIWQL